MSELNTAQQTVVWASLRDLRLVARNLKAEADGTPDNVLGLSLVREADHVMDCCILITEALRAAGIQLP